MCAFSVGEENRTRHHRPRSADDERIRGGGSRDRAGETTIFTDLLLFKRRIFRDDDVRDARFYVTIRERVESASFSREHPSAM